MRCTTTRLASLGSQPADCRAAALLQGAAAVTADGVIAFTGRDAARALQLGARQVHLVPCGATVPQGTISSRAAGRAGPPRVGFVGNLHYEPNLRALRYLAERLVPHLGERAVVDVFGRYPPVARGLAAQAIAGGTLCLHGPVGDLPGALARMTLAVAPLDSGGGMKIKVLDYLGAGLATVGTKEAFLGFERPEEIALVSHDATMRDLPELVDILLTSPALREQLGARARERVTCHHTWVDLAATAQHAYQVIAAARASTSPSGRLPPVPREVAELARRTPYWLAEWRSREPRSGDNAPMSEQATAHAPNAPVARAGRLAEDIDCARLAATAALGVRFDAEAAVGYAGRSMVFFAPTAVLKVYTHRPSERAYREVAGITLAATYAPGVRVAEVLGHDDVPGALSWVATTRLSGTHPSRDQLATPTVARHLGHIAARLHAIPVEHLGALPIQARRIRTLPPSDPAGVEAGHRLVEALEAVEPHQRVRCERGFVHGDLSSRNVFLLSEPVEKPSDELGGQRWGIIDFEGCGLGCVYDDLATLVMQDGLLGTADVDQLLAGYQDERAARGHPHPSVDREHLTVHLGWRARWMLQWAIEIDRPLTEQVLALTPTLLAALAGQRTEATW